MKSWHARTQRNAKGKKITPLHSHSVAQDTTECLSSHSLPQTWKHHPEAAHAAMCVHCFHTQPLEVRTQLCHLLSSFNDITDMSAGVELTPAPERQVGISDQMPCCLSDHSFLMGTDCVSRTFSNGWLICALPLGTVLQ